MQSPFYHTHGPDTGEDTAAQHRKQVIEFGLPLSWSSNDASDQHELCYDDSRGLDTYKSCQGPANLAGPFSCSNCQVSSASRLVLQEDL